MSKNIPPLTDFEEEFLATRLMQKIPTNSSMLDAQLCLHHEAIAVVQKNYRLKVKRNCLDLLIILIEVIH